MTTPAGAGWLAPERPRARRLSRRRDTRAVRRRAGSATRVAPRLDSVAEHVQHRQRIVPADAAVGDALAVLERGGIVLAGRELLGAGVQVALDHDAEDARVAGGDLGPDVARDVDLAFVFLLAVGVAEVHHQLALELRRLEFAACGRHAGRVVVRRLA